MKHYLAVQSLRGLGALLVLVFHTTVMLHDHIDASLWQFSIGGVGVDIFFAISGFIMVVSTATDWGKLHTAIPFLTRRIMRIFPLYWVATTLKLGILLIVPAVALHSSVTLWPTIFSYALIPAWNSDHLAQPLLIVGWTLYFEMFFYLLFTGALALRIHPVRWLSALLVLLSGLCIAMPASSYAILTLLNPLLLEFVAGMGIGVLVLKARLLPPSIARCAVLLAFSALALTALIDPALCLRMRVLVWGIPSGLLLYAAVSLENDTTFWAKPLPRYLGDASYAIYLLHGFILPPVGIILSKMHLGVPLSILLGVAVSVPASCIVGIVAHRRLERPFMRFFRARSSACSCRHPLVIGRWTRLV